MSKPKWTPLGVLVLFLYMLPLIIAAAYMYAAIHFIVKFW